MKCAGRHGSLAMKLFLVSFYLVLLAGQVARAAAVFSVDEVVVYDDEGVKDKTNSDLV